MCDLDANRQQNCLPRMQLGNVFEKDESIDVCFIPKKYVNRKCGMLLSRRTWLFPLQQHLINCSDRLINYMKLLWRRKKGKKTQALNLTAIQRGKRKRKHQSWGLLFQLPWKHPSKPNISMSLLLIIIWFDCTSLKL